ncbi:MAG: murein biosynthesis integral membrane protein MurJ [Alphaproteobacteria bacterium]|nr:murein biosynthesis integral membrane protein MurJ [Alphaproteobacteria bacterium]
MSRRIGIASLIWGFSILLSRFIGVLREAVIGRVLGGGAEADVYWAAFVLPDFLNYLLAGGALTIVFIPIFSRYLAEEREDEGWRVFSTIFNFALLLLTAATAALWVAAPRIVPQISPGFDAAQLAELTRLTRIILPAQIFHVLGGLLSSTLQAQDRHVAPAFANLGYTACIVGFGVALGPRLGGEAFAWGVLIGSVVGPFGLPLVDCLRTRLGWSPTLALRHPDFRRYFLLSLPIMLAFSIVVVDDWLIKRFASLAGDGVISRLQYGRILMKVPMGVFGLATGTAAYPTLSRLVARGELHEAHDTLVKACRMMLVLAFTAQAAFTVAGADIATVIWGTARFTPAEHEQIGLFTGAFCLGLGAWSAQTLIARGFYAQQKTWLPSLVGSVAVLVAWPLYPLLGERLGGLGLALASSIAVTGYTVVLALMLRRSIAAAGAPRISTLVLRMAPAVALGVAAGRGLDGLVQLPPLLQGALTGGVAAAACLVAAHLLGAPEVGTVTRLVRDKLARRLKRA